MWLKALWLSKVPELNLSSLDIKGGLDLVNLDSMLSNMVADF